MSARRLAVAAAAIAGWLAFAAAVASASTAPGWSIHVVGVPTNFVPGSSGQAFYEVSAINSGGSTTDGSPVVLTDVLASGLSVEGVDLFVRSAGGRENVGSTACEVEEVGGRPIVSCEVEEGLPGTFEPARLLPGGAYQLIVHVAVPPGASGELPNEATVEGGGALARSASAANEASSTPAGAGVAYFDTEAVNADGSLTTQAGAHPFQFATSFAVNTEPGPPGRPPFVPAGGDIKDIEVALPPGLIGNATTVTRCTAQDFANVHVVITGIGSNVFKNSCPAGSVVGYIFVQQLEGIDSHLYEPVYELVPPKGMPAQFGFQVVGAPFYVNTKVRTGTDYGITAFLENTSEVKRITSARTVFWGAPADPSHDRFRGACLNEADEGSEGLSLGSCPSGTSSLPFFTMPTSCESPLTTDFMFDTWTLPGTFNEASSVAPTPTGCGSLTFNPTLSVVPQTTVADSPTGLAVDLHLPQDESLNGYAEPDLRDAVIQLPKGMTVNPASAAGLESCSPSQIGLKSPIGVAPAVFSPAPAECPAAAQLGSVEIDTPLLDHPIRGEVYLADQGQNPFGSLLAIYIAAHDPESGVVVKLAGKVEADEATGQLTTRFQNNPQLPFEDLSVQLFEGPRAPLRTPATCGTYTATGDLRPWSAPQSGPDATLSSSFSVTSAPEGRPCAKTEAELPNAPSLSAGTQVPLAGAYSPFSLRLKRGDDTQQLGQISLTMPKGLTGKLAGIPYCPDVAIAGAAGKSGKAEAATPSCPSASQIGSARVGVGAGSQPFHVSGKAYLAGPYRGAPLSVVVITPALAGPLDLGTVVVRSALQVDPTTAQVSVLSDDLPTILEGIPLDIRDITLNLDRPDFILNPTNCEPSAIAGSITSTQAQAATVSSRFQVGGCRGLGFSPLLSLDLKGGSKRNAHPALHAVLKAKAGQANIARTVVTLPPTEFIDQAHINNPCTRVQFAEERCPKTSILGRARVFTPLLDHPLEGRVYFRSNGSERELPDLAIDLRGQIHLVLLGFIDSVRKPGSETAKIRTTFATVPDAPVSKFVLSLKGGSQGLLVNSRNLCRHTLHALVRMKGQNGKRHGARPLLRTSCREHSAGHRR